MNIDKAEELGILKAALIHLRNTQLYPVITTLNISLNDTALDGLKDDLNRLDIMLDKLDKELKEFHETEQRMLNTGKVIKKNGDTNTTISK